MAKKKTVRSKTLDERIVEAFKKMAKDAEYEADNVRAPYGGYVKESKDRKAFDAILEELAIEEQETKSYTVNLTDNDKDTIESEMDGWCLSAAAKASIRKALKL